jgi:hypothetical protein
MDHELLKKKFLQCKELSSLSETAMARLWWRGSCVEYDADTDIYAEGMLMDNTFCLLLSGAVVVTANGQLLGQIPTGHLFGEVAYFSANRTRTATVRVVDGPAKVMMFRVTPEELQSANFAAIESLLNNLAWEKRQSDAQNRQPLNR